MANSQAFSFGQMETEALEVTTINWALVSIVLVFYLRVKVALLKKSF
jgi:hypothetical protein